MAKARADCAIGYVPLETSLKFQFVRATFGSDSGTFRVPSGVLLGLTLGAVGAATFVPSQLLNGTTFKQKSLQNPQLGQLPDSAMVQQLHRYTCTEKNKG